MNVCRKKEEYLWQLEQLKQTERETLEERRIEEENLFMEELVRIIPFVKKKEEKNRNYERNLLELRSKILDISAILDRFDRAKENEDERLEKYKKAIKIISTESERTEKILTLLSN